MQESPEFYRAAIYSAKHAQTDAIRVDGTEAFGGENVWVLSVSPSTLKRFNKQPGEMCGAFFVRRGPFGREIVCLQLQAGHIQLRSFVGLNNPTLLDFMAAVLITGELAVRLLDEDSGHALFLRYRIDPTIAREILAFRANQSEQVPTAQRMLELAHVSTGGLVLDAYPEMRCPVRRVEVSVAIVGEALLDEETQGAHDGQEIEATSAYVGNRLATRH